jgi:DNA-binding SARP family transcriptional activator/pimeloyl-ACP methyl ester carboxylesterase
MLLAMPERLQIDVLGELSVRRAGAALPLPQSKKTRALLGYLVLQSAPQRREALCELLWDLPDDPRAALRWSLTKLRPLLNDAVERLEADRERVTFQPRGADIDLTRIRGGCEAGLEQRDASALWALERAFRGPLLEGLELPTQPAFATWRLGQQEQARRLHLRVLDALAQRLNDTPEQMALALRRRIEIDPGDEAAHAQLIAALARSGAKAEAEQQHAASARMLEGLGAFDRTALDGALRQMRAPAPRAAPAPPETLRQDVHFCPAGDGVRIAYAKVGQGPPLLKTANWLNHLEFDWQSPIWRHFFRAFAEDHALVRYDSRGNGLSDWNAAFSLDAFVGDLEAVADAAGLERFPLLAISQGCPVAVEFAVRHPERVSKLVLYGGYACGWRKRDDPTLVAQREAMLTLTRTGWGRDNPAFRQLFATLFVPDSTPEHRESFNQLQRVTTSPDNAARLMDSFSTLDVRDRLSLVRAPTLVMHVREDARVGHAEGLELAAGIPGARFVTLEGKNHLLLDHEPAWPRFVAEIRAFLAE